MSTLYLSLRMEEPAKLSTFSSLWPLDLTIHLASSCKKAYHWPLFLMTLSQQTGHFSSTKMSPCSLLPQYNDRLYAEVLSCCLENGKAWVTMLSRHPTSGQCRHLTTTAYRSTQAWYLAGLSLAQSLLSSILHLSSWVTISPRLIVTPFSTTSWSTNRISYQW